MPRSIKKGPYIDVNLLKKLEKTASDSKVEIKTWARDCTIIPEMIGKTVRVHNGKDFVSVKIHEEMVGHRLGEFSPTTKFMRHGGKMQRELESKIETKESAKVEEKSSLPSAKK